MFINFKIMRLKDSPQPLINILYYLIFTNGERSGIQTTYNKRKPYKQSSTTSSNHARHKKRCIWQRRIIEPMQKKINNNMVDYQKTLSLLLLYKNIAFAITQQTNRNKMIVKIFDDAVYLSDVWPDQQNSNIKDFVRQWSDNCLNKDIYQKYYFPSNKERINTDIPRNQKPSLSAKQHKKQINFIIIYSHQSKMNYQTLKQIDHSVKPCRSLLLVSRKKFKNIRHCHTKKGNQKRGMWNLAETIKYISFVKENAEKFATEQCRRESKVFCLMAKEIRTRSSVQCRSHHQKMIQTYGELPRIISHYEQNVIPYYSAKATASDTKSTDLSPPESFYSLKLAGSVLRIEIMEECIEEY